MLMALQGRGPRQVREMIRLARHDLRHVQRHKIRLKSHDFGSVQLSNTGLDRHSDLASSTSPYVVYDISYIHIYTYINSLYNIPLYLPY